MAIPAWMSDIIKHLMEKTNKKILNEFKNFLELELLPFRMEIKVFKNTKRDLHVFRVLKKGKVIVQIPVKTKHLLDQKIKHLNITLQIGEGVKDDQRLLSNAASAATAYLKLYKDLLDKNAEHSELDYYESYFKLVRKKWLGEEKN